MNVINHLENLPDGGIYVDLFCLGLSKIVSSPRYFRDLGVHLNYLAAGYFPEKKALRASARRKISHSPHWLESRQL